MVEAIPELPIAGEQEEEYFMAEPFPEAVAAIQ